MQTVTLEARHFETIGNTLIKAELEARRLADGLDAAPALKGAFLSDACRLRQAFDALTMAMAR